MDAPARYLDLLSNPAYAQEKKLFWLYQQLESLPQLIIRSRAKL